MSRNLELFERGKQVIPGGVNSPVRAFGQVGGTPRFVKRAEGAYFWDADDKQYLDYVGSWGPAILGHAHPEVVKAVQDAAVGGLSFGAPTEGEVEIAEEICKLLPSVEQVRLVSSGTEATMTAIRLARGFTGRDLIVKFEGCYHGHSDSLLVKAGSGLLTFGNPSSGGVPADCTKHTLVLQYNDVQQLADTFKELGDKIAGVILEPIAGNMNLIKPSAEFVQALRALTEQYGAVLIYDEVMTGFRVALGCAQGLHGITPDLTTLGKVVGGGMPLAAFGGRADIMGKIAPLGNVYQAGTLSGNPLSVAAGLATLRLIQQPGFHDTLGRRSARLAAGLADAARDAGIAMTTDSVGGMFGFYFSDTVPASYAEATRCDITRFKAFFHAMLDEGVYLAPSAYEAGFISIAHTDELVEQTISAARRALSRV
ncbi:glutamate-1-semialdehyde 2,1-aminomutase [Vogesella indigofera]|uniref:glutamate-1-semialdehyde 2,1-aminomutase n=1 Tax=Vogesella indigofera TaxID=45465 RepID=UPI00234E83FD|nr:glutamate-1-semialdehyde 2,1-aminomutase [Vogesella indigofera]MDC7701238.1 glutamate-1-semialdehyde 2,1-aminomutase [Vogesella indigofera]MDC7708474.1 glutamate-1-semialdehyde 2,1-aminomutase [Vogesella indigofera]MDC7709436.1 glutamate-1-semialdehyde 2,1-aminomutase [Vogesella indigofera]